LTTGCNKGEYEGEQVSIVYRRKADYSKDPFEAGRQRPLSPYIEELFERSDRAIEKLKRKE
jgi:hypothetical protein